MLVDPSSLTAGQTLDADVCIIGAGAAGITVARALADSPLRVIVLEGGGFEPSERSQALYDGEMATTYRPKSSRLAYDKTYVARSRLRYFGGTTNHWNGWCRPLEPSDFAPREWVPRSGWPISRTQMDPWYDKARELVEIPAYEDDHGYGRKPGRRMVCLADSEDIVTRLFHWSPPTRFGTRWRDAVVNAPNVRLLVEANVLRLHAGEGRGAVEHAEVQIEDGPAVTVRARRFVVACGGIENARLLLLSELGGDNVGRFFMEHPHVPSVGQIVIADDGAPTTPSAPCTSCSGPTGRPGRSWFRRLPSISPRTSPAARPSRSSRGTTPLFDVGDFRFILDRPHCKEHLTKAGEALAGEGLVEAEGAQQWAAYALSKLEVGNTGEVVAELTYAWEASGPDPESRNDKLRREAAYFERNADAVVYAEYRAAGWSTASSEAESAHGHVVQARLKIAGALWHPDHVDDVLALRMLKRTAGGTSTGKINDEPGGDVQRPSPKRAPTALPDHRETTRRPPSRARPTCAWRRPTEPCPTRGWSGSRRLGPSRRP